jgi:N-acetylmuramoyl-L-alanine amidase
MKKIIVDAGHGPHTAGKRSPDETLKEFMFNEAVAIRVKKLLSSEGLTVIFSHDNTRDVALSERISLANKLKVDAFVSIHANAFGTDWNAAHGIETYTCLHPSKASVIMATQVQQALLMRTSRKDRGIKKGDFAVLRETTMPAILVECGFMTNKEEAILLKSSIYQQQCAQAIAFGVLCWLA